MKRILFILTISLGLVSYGFSQTTLFSDDFESFNAGDHVAQSDASGYWTTWSGATGGSEDGIISTDYNNTASGANSMMISGSNDQILKLGNKTSGTYEINFWCYVETGYAGYFNFQKYEEPGNEWAVEIYFHEDGSGRLVQNGDHTFSYPKDTWFFVSATVDLDGDAATMSINGNQVHSWPFSQQADGTAGLLQLGGIDFYAGVESNSGETPKMYYDDVEYIQTVQGSNPPDVGVSVTDITTNGTADETFDVVNNGDQDLTYQLFITYPQSSNKQRSINKSVVLYNGGTKAKDAAMTNVQSDLNGGVGYSSALTVNAASYFSPTAVQDYIGMELTSIIIGINDLPGASSTSAKVWGRGSTTTPGPGNLLDEVDFTPSGTQSQNLVDLTSPIYIDGNPIWLGYQCDDPGDGVFPMGIDAGPRVDGVNWLSIGPGWSEMNSATDANLFIIGNLTGTAITKWLSVSPTSGTITGGNSETITASFDLTNLTTGTYTSNIVIASNDQGNNHADEYVEIPVTLDVNTDVENINSGVMTFPNPVTDIFTIISDNKINSIIISDISGRITEKVTPLNKSYKFNMSNLSSGIYFVKINTEKQTITRKIIVK